MNTITKLALVAVLGVFTSACWFTDLFNGPQGFKVRTTFTALPSPTQNQLILPDPNVSVSGVWLNDLAGSRCGGDFSFGGNTNSDGKFNVSNGRVPASWRLSRFGGHTGCDRLITSFPLALTCGAEVAINCGAGSLFTMAPGEIDLTAPPATAAFTGEGLSTTYGMPTIEFYDEYGSYFSQTYATSVSSDGTWLQAPVPSLVGLYSGTYTIVIVNATADGSRNALGTASVWAYGNDYFFPPPPPDPDPDPCGGANRNNPDCVLPIY